MSLYRVTVTGAGDRTDIGRMVDLSAQYPFVEWALLMSRSHQDGGGRWPSTEWIANLGRNQYRLANPLHVAAHLCGKWRASAMEGIIDLPPDWFGRIQLNTHAEPAKLNPGVAEKWARLMESRIPQEIIFQLDNVNGALIYQALREGLIGVAGLFDLSHGAGKYPSRWPSAIADFKCGYAGGLGPENVSRALMEIREVAGDAPFWIDAETRLLTNGWLDLDKVEAYLKAAAPFVAPSPPE